ncbi:hypothetical protein T439DRAFT_321959 [Meredithblackwellia eburnea MCA 4105]
MDDLFNFSSPAKLDYYHQQNSLVTTITESESLLDESIFIPDNLDSQHDQQQQEHLLLMDIDDNHPQTQDTNQQLEAEEQQQQQPLVDLMDGDLELIAEESELPFVAPLDIAQLDLDAQACPSAPENEFPLPLVHSPPKQSITAPVKLADVFFPSRTVTNKQEDQRQVQQPKHLKRLSLPTSILSTVKLPASPTRNSETSRVRKSLSPTHASTRRLSSSTTTTTSSSKQHSSKPQPRASLLALPLAGQLFALKARNSSLESSLASLASAKDAELFKATERIKMLQETGEVGKIERLEEEVQRRALECEGWEAEAVRLGKEVDRLEERKDELERSREEAERLRREVGKAKFEIDMEKKNKKRYKDQCSRLKGEMVARKLKEKWELAIMDAGDRQTDAAFANLEFELANLRLQNGIQALEIEELEETVQEQQTQISNLEGARSVLLNSFNGSEDHATKLRVDLVTAKKEAKDAQKALAISDAALADALQGAEQAEELRNEVALLQEELKKIEKGEKKSEEKQVADLKKALEKEKASRVKAEADAKEGKATIKELQTELKGSKKSLAAANKETQDAQSTLAEARAKAKAKKAATALAPVSVLASRQRRSLTKDGSDPVDDLRAEGNDDEDAGQEEPVGQSEDEREREAEMDDEPSPPRSKKGRNAARSPSPPLSVSSTEDLYRPIKSKSRSAPAPVVAKEKATKSKAVPAHARASSSAPVPVTTPTKKRKVVEAEQTDEVHSIEEDEEQEEEVPAAAAFGKGPKSMLNNKSTNKNGNGNGKKEEETAVVGKRDSDKILLKVKPPKDGGKEDGKKKKRKLFDGPRKFNWEGIENAEINGLGLPTSLSPVKQDKKASGLFGGFGGGVGGGFGGGRSNLFGY